MISAQTLRVCREGKPLHTFPDHALAGPRFHREAVEEIFQRTAAGEFGRPMGTEAALTQFDAQRLPLAPNLPGPALGAFSAPGNDDIKRAARRGACASIPRPPLPQAGSAADSR